MYTYVFLFRFRKDDLRTIRRIEIKALSTASAHCLFYEVLGYSPALENGTFLLMAEQSAIGTIVFMGDDLNIITGENPVICC